MTLVSERILSPEQMNQKIRRMAFEIYENHVEDTHLYLVGVQPIGYQIAEQLTKELALISSIRVHLESIELDKTRPTQSDIRLSCEYSELENKPIILVDDVLNTGRTLAYSLKAFLEVHIQKLQVLVLVDRNHPTFPIAADYVGYALSTTIKQHIDVVVSGDEKGVYLR